MQEDQQEEKRQKVEPRHRVLREHPNGRPMVRETTYDYVDKGFRRILLHAQDLYGESPFGIIAQTLETNEDFHKARIVARDEGLPTLVDDVIQDFDKISRERMDLPVEGLSEDEIVRRQIRYSYDSEGRVVTKTVARKVLTEDKSNLFSGKEILIPEQETQVHYDEQGRLKAVATYTFKEDGTVVLDEARMFGYEDIGENKVSVSEVVYKPLDFFNPDGRLIPSYALVNEVNPQTLDIINGATYEDERATRNMHLTNPEFVRKYPQTVILYKKEREPVDLPVYVSVEEQIRRWRGAPSEIAAPTVITEKSLRRYLAGGDFLKISDLSEAGRVRVFYFEEYFDQVSRASDEDAIKLATQV